MKLSFLTLYFAFSFSSQIIAQRPVYNLSVSLDPATHLLQGTGSITYTNQSAIELDSLAVHLWANAYADKNSAFAKQMLRLGEFDFQFANEDEMGGYKSIQFSHGSSQLSLHIDPGHKDIAWIILPSSLESNQTIQLDLRFLLQIPYSFSRLGRTGDSYQLTQWYPHIAVHDLEGWHTMPYLELGEYYNEFADYQVSMKVPSSYVIAATGVQTQRLTDGNYTTWTFEAENVIDFAWFANPHFQRQQKDIVWEDGSKTELNIYIDPAFSNHWHRAMAWAERAMRFYTEWLGAYPYPQMSVVSAPFSAGGFMEYPMVAQIAASTDTAFLDNVIAHEIGHTWLYAILASNERWHPWMDEGLNTFFERKYSKQYHPGYEEVYFPGALTSPFSMSHEEALLHIMQHNNSLQPPVTRPDDQLSNQYVYSAYTLPALGLEMMENRLGDNKIKQMFRSYFAENKFTRVAPVDLRVSFEKECDCDLSWFFDGWIREVHQLDYRIKKFNRQKSELVIENRGTENIPVQVSAYMNGREVTNVWIEGFHGQKTFRLDSRANEVRLFEDVPGVNRQWNRAVYPKSFLPHISIIPKVASYEKHQLSITPLYGFNVADGLLPGPIVVSNLIPQSKFKWILAPLYGIKSNKIRGFAEGRFVSDIRKGIFDKFLLDASIHHFGFKHDEQFDLVDHYHRLSPAIGLRFHQDDKHTFRNQWLKYRYVHAFFKYSQLPGWPVGEFSFSNYGIHELSFTQSSSYPFRPFRVSGNVQAGSGFVRLNLKYNQHFAGRNRFRGTWIHAYAGFMPVYDDPDANVSFTLSGTTTIARHSTDYMYDQWLGGRTETEGILSRQVFTKDAGLKTLFADDISNDWMGGLGFSHALPFPLFHIYTDAAAYESVTGQKMVFSYSGGISAVLWKDIFEIYLPLWESKNIREGLNYENREWHERISFQVNLKFFNPLEMVDRESLGY